MLLKFLALFCIFVGEALCIYSEVLAAQLLEKLHIGDALFLDGVWKAFPFIIIGGVVVFIGYILGIKYFHNIWIVSAISVACILLVEPTLDWTLFHEFPTRGATIGLFCGAVGLIATLF